MDSAVWCLPFVAEVPRIMSGPPLPTKTPRIRVRALEWKSPSWYPRETFLRSLLLHFGQRKSILSPLAAPLRCGYQSFLATIRHYLAKIKPRPSELVARSWSAGLCARHSLSHVKYQFAISFFCPGQQPPKFAEIPCVFPRTAPGDVIRRLPLWKIRQVGRLLSIVEKLVHWNFHRAGHFLQRFDGRHRMPVLNSGDVTAKQSSPLFNISLGELFFFPSRVSAKPAMQGHFKTGHSRPGTLDVVPIGDLSCKSHF